MSGLYSDRKRARERQKPKLPPKGGVFHTYELRRLAAMVVAALVIGTLSLQAILGRAGREQAPATAPAEMQAAATPDSIVVLPEIDVAQLEALVSDATPAQRVTLDVGALAWAFDTTRNLRGPHFRELGTTVLDAGAADELLSDPPAHRGAAYRARGWLEDVRFYEAAGRLPGYFRAGLRLEGGGRAWIAVRDIPDSGFEDGDFVRVDGLFVELFRDQVGAGWIEQPLVVGREAVSSYPALPPASGPPSAALDLVLDDTTSAITGLPFEPFWELMAYVRDLDRDAIDWDAAPLVTMEVLNAIHADGQTWRGKPVRFPACEVLDCWAFDPGENPARLDRMTEGWLGNWTWKGPAVVVRFQSPAGFGDDIARRDVASARGFFFKNLAYESQDGTTGFAPFFVVHSAEKVPPAEKSGVLRTVTFIISGSLLGLGVLVGVLLVRDRRRSRELQADLVRRRRARREQRLREDAAAEGS